MVVRFHPSLLGSYMEEYENGFMSGEIDAETTFEFGEAIGPDLGQFSEQWVKGYRAGFEKRMLELKRDV